MGTLRMICCLSFVYPKTPYQLPRKTQGKMKTKCPQGATLIAAIVNVNYVFYASFLLEQ